MDQLKLLELLAPQKPLKDLYLIATVTQAAPLRIKLDGDTEPLPFTPHRLAGPVLEPENRVLCRLEGQRVIILGKFGGTETVSGQNEHGHWVRFVDGTQICWLYVARITDAYPVTNSAGWDRSNVLYWYFPAVFIDNSVTFLVDGLPYTSSGLYRFGGRCFAQSSSGTIGFWRVLCPDTQSFQEVRNVNLLAKGRWKE